jgi:hypothetical protein
MKPNERRVEKRSLSVSDGHSEEERARDCGVNDGTPVGTEEATAHGLSGGYSASGFTESLTIGSHGDPTDSRNLAGAVTGPGNVPGFGVVDAQGEIRHPAEEKEKTERRVATANAGSDRCDERSDLYAECGGLTEDGGSTS